jgi:hypothetical protein
MRKTLPTSNRKVLMYVYTAAAVTITIGGTLYGAELATNQEKKQVLSLHDLPYTENFSKVDNFSS